MKLKSILLFLIITTVFSLSLKGQIFINELVSSNSAGIADPDFDDTGDWIELYNNSSYRIDLSGFYLTDNFDEFDKWEFPSGTSIAANAHLIVWADGADTGTHTNFKLTKDGEEIGLYDNDGNTIDSIIYSNQRTDISFGRISDGHESWGYFEEPTPKAANTTTASKGIVFYRPNFSLKGGFYKNSQSIEITSIDGEIRYTLDGTIPTRSSIKYESPILLEETTVLRARVLREDYIAGKVGTQSYFIKDDLEARGLPVVSVATDPDNFWDTESGLYVQDFKPEWEYPINIELFENDGGNRAAINELAGIRVNGKNSWELPQKMLGVYFDNEYDENNIDYPLFPDRRRSRFDNFVLRVGGSDWSTTMLRDGLCQGLTRGRMNLSSTGFKPTIVFVNGKYLGLHNLRSRLDEGFIEENYDMDGNSYDLIENNGEVEEGDDLAFGELFDLFDQDLTIVENYEALSSIMDIENYIDFYIAEIWSSNSSYGHNIQFWKPKNSDSKWKWIAQDFDRGFTGSYNDLIDRFRIEPNENYEWVSAGFNNILNNEEFASAFVSRMLDQLYTSYHPIRVINLINEYEKAIADEMPYQIARWQGTESDYGDAIPSVAYWNTEVENLRIFAKERPDFIYDDMIGQFDLGEKVSLGIFSDNSLGGTHYINDLSIPSTNWLGNYITNISFQLTAKPHAGFEFLGWSKNREVTLISKESEWKYFDNGDLPSAIWTHLEFDDTSWSSGQAQLGYGDGDENTVIDYGNSSSNKHIASYFRKTISTADLENIQGPLIINLLKDDGAVIYLNGKEIIRDNMPNGEINSETTAREVVGGTYEDIYTSYIIDNEALQDGDNTIAVEIHQYNSTSSDLSFDLELKVLQQDDQGIISTSESIPVNLEDAAYYMAHYQTNSSCILPDSIRADTTLTLDCSPYFARETVVILADASLTVEAGVEIHFPANEGMHIQGSLQVEGREDSPVKFLLNETQGGSQWSNLYFANTSDKSSLEWLEISGASRGEHPIKENAAISAWFSEIDINHLTIEDNFSNPILARYSDISMRNSRLHSKVTGDLINIKYGKGLIENCTFRGNNLIDTDAIDYDEVTDGIIRNSEIYSFNGFNSDGIDLGEVSKNVLIENNFIHHITDKGISAGQQSTFSAVNNIIVECDQGIGIKDESIGLIDQNTFYNNARDIVAFEKNVGIGGGEVKITNSIFSNTAFDPLSIDRNSDSSVSYSISDTKELVGTANLLGNPQFENPTHHDFNLKSNSIAIAAGNDLNSNTIDIGAKGLAIDRPASLVLSAIDYNPMDNPDREFIRIYNPTESTIALEGYAITAGVEFTFLAGSSIAPKESIHLVKDKDLFTGHAGQFYEWATGKLSNGGEQIILRDNYGIIIDHVTYDDKSPWPNEADENGAYLELIHSDLDNHFASSWTTNIFVATDEDASSTRPSFSISPNPTSDRIDITTTGKEIHLVELYDASGKRVAIKESDRNTVSLSLEAFPSGPYYVRINKEAIKKIILIK